MIIKEIKDENELLKCMPYEITIRHKGRDSLPLKESLLLLREQLKNPFFKTWIIYDDESEIIGYCVAASTVLPKQQYIQRMYAKDSEVRQELERLLKEWAKSFKIKKQVITVRKNVKAYQRKHGFKAVSINMERIL